MDKHGTKTAAVNRKASHDYFIEERYEAGIGFFAPATRTLGRAARPLLGPARTLLRPTGPLLRPAGGFSIITHVRFLL